MKFVRTTRTAILTATALALGLSTTHAAQDFWTGANNDNWFNNGNWSLGNPPTAVDSGHIGNSTVANSLARIGAPGAVANNVFLGDAAGQTGELRIVNNGSLNTTRDLDVGEGGGGTAFLADASQTNVGINVNIADLAGSTGDMTVRDGANLAVTNNLRIGTGGAGTLTIKNFATVSATNVDAGVLAGSNGMIDVSGDPGVFTFNLASTANTTIGNAGTGSLTVHDGGIVITSGNATMGNMVSGIGTAIVRGENSGQQSTWQIGGNATVGDLGIGDLEVHNGAEVDIANNLRIARQGGSIGTVIVEGTGASVGTPSVLNVGNNAFVGGDVAGPGGEGEMRIVNGGIVSVTNNMTVWGPGTGARGTLSVDSTYTLNVGTLTFAGGLLNFVGDGVDFINDVNLDNVPGPDQNGMHANVSDGNTATLDGLLSGNGHLVKTGTGTLILNNINNVYTGGTDINNGTLIVGAPSTGFNSVFGGGDVNLNGDINTRLRTPEGTPLAYVIFGDFNANTGQLYTQVGGTSSGIQSDEMIVFGVADLDPANSHLFVHRINGYNPNNGDVVTIIGTLGGVFGQFSDAPPNAPAPNDFIGLIRPFADYGNIDPGDVDLVFGFAAPFVSVARTPNQIATAAALDAAVAAGCIIPATNVLGNVPVNTLRHAYDLIAPEELASMYEASFAQGMVTSLNLQHRMDDIRWGSTGFCADGFVIQDNHGYTKNDGKSVADKNVVEQTAPPNTRWGAFITGSGELTKTGQEDDNGDHSGYQLNQAGFTMGVDYRVTDHFAIGLSGGYTHTKGDLVDNGRLNTDGGRMGIYSTWYTGGFYVDTAVNGGWNQYDTRRSAYLGQENGSTDGAEFNGMVAAGYDWKKGCWSFGPTASFEYDYVELNSFTEGDTSLIPLHFPDQNQEAYRTNLGFRVAHEQVMKPGEGLTVVPELRAAWRHDFGPSAYAIDSNFVGCADTFTVHGPWIGRDSAVVDLGLTAYCTPGLSAYIFYDGQFGRDNYNNNGISGGFRVAF